MRSILLVSLLTCLVFNAVFAQRTCIIREETTNASVVEQTEITSAAPDVITIPVVVHILYNSSEQNISDAQVKSQLAVLNQDYRKKNPDASHIPEAFRALAADTRIEFRLATKDPAGLATSGIIRKSTPGAGFAANDEMKSSLTGGDDAWDRDQYLNIWVCNLSGGVMGYASSPGCAPEKDGVVIRYNAFGSTGTVQAPYNKGRTAVHEIGHWLGLRHIWGDASCGDDKIADTPPQQGPTRGCPSGVVATCTSGAAGNMYMNFMDFTNDECTNMFTIGQADKMRQLFAGGGARLPLLSSDKAEGAIVDDVLDQDAASENISLYPNPAKGMLNIRLSGNDAAIKSLSIYNHLGQRLKTIIPSKNNLSIDVRDLKPGMYFLSTGSGKSFKFLKS